MNPGDAACRRNPASQRELRIPLLRRHRKLDTESRLMRQAVPQTLRRAFPVTAFHTTDERWEDEEGPLEAP